MAEEIVARYRAEVDDAVNKLKTLAGANTQVGSTSDKAITSMNNMGKSAGNLGRELAAAFGIGATVAGFAMLVKSSAGTLMDFEKQMSTVKAVSGATDAEFKKLEASAKALGASTKFTATEVGMLQEEFAKLGFSTDEILAATEATLNLAAATGTSLADAASVAGSVIRGFGLSAEETTRVTDVMALSFSKSALGLSDFAEAMKYVAPIAKVANIDVETTTALLGKLADAGLKGSIAGTSLKNLLTHLSDANSDLSKKLGFSVKNSDDLFKAFKQLQTANIDLTAATELTDERSKAAFLTFIDGVDGAMELKTALDSASGAAKTMADTMSDNLAGDIDQLTSAWEGLILTIGNTGPMRKAAQALTGIFGDMKKTYMSDQEFFETFTLADNLEAAEASARKFTKSLDGSDSAQAELEAHIASTTEEIEKLEAARKKYAVTEEYSKRELTPWADYRIQVESLKVKVEVYTKSLQALLAVEEELAKGKAKPAKIDNLVEMAAKAKDLKDALELLPVFTERWINKFKELDAVNMRIKAAQNLVANLRPEVEKPMVFEIETENIKTEWDQQAEYLDWKETRTAEVNAHMKALRDQDLADALAAMDAEQEGRDMVLEDLNKYAGVAINLTSLIGDAQRQQTESELQLLETSLAQGQITREEYDRKRRELLTEQAKEAKTIALFQAVVNGIVAVVNSLRDGGPIMAAITAVMVAAEVAVIAAEPIPKFAKGGWVEGAKHTSGGVKIEAEGGEFIVNARQAGRYSKILEAINRDRFDAEQVRGWAGLSDSININGMGGGGFNDMNLLSAIDRHREGELSLLRLIASKLENPRPKRGGYA